MHPPEKGFYYHYKHDPAGEFNNYAYEVLGVARHSETEEYTVIYRPLYANTYLNNADFSTRPLAMFNEETVKDGVSIPRFTHISDPALIAKLEEVKAQMYSATEE